MRKPHADELLCAKVLGADLDKVTTFAQVKYLKHLNISLASLVDGDGLYLDTGQRERIVRR